ncbi:MAG: hypothetical protein GF320_21145 [Armatimonadia bacterium]|nr:hypothetical protein [Armatimonadia bacterium]
MSSALVSSVSSEELAGFCSEFAVMLASDVKLMPAIVTLRQQTENVYFREVLLEVQEDLENGFTLAAAFARHPDVFSPFLIQLVRQGELEGALPEVFRKVAEHYAGGEMGAEGLGGGSGPVVVNLDISTIVEVLRPLLVMLPTALAFVGFAIAGIWVAMEREWIPGEQAGPTILATAALSFLLVAAAFSRFRPRRVSSCSFCGKLDSEVSEIVTSRGVSICDECVESMVHQMRRAGEPVAAPAEAVAAADQVAPSAVEKTDKPEGALRPDDAYLLRDPGEPVDLDKEFE